MAAGTNTSDDVDDDAELKRAADLSRMHAALMWRSYIFAHSANPKRWQKDQVCALGTLKILSTCDSAQVMLRTAQSAEVICTNVRDDDWPLRAFINLYLRYKDLLAEELSAITPAQPIAK